MMIRKWIAVVLCAWILVGVAGCSKEHKDTQVPTTQAQGGQENPTVAPVEYPPMVKIDGNVYRDWRLKAEGINIGESEILGRITFTIKNTSRPSRDNEANYARAHNAPYARWNDATYGEVYVIQYGGSWYILLPEDYPMN